MRTRFFYHHSKKIRTLHHLGKQLKRLASSEPSKLFQKTAARWRRLFEELRPILPAFHLRKAMAGAAILAGLALPAASDAQIMFADPENNPFGYTPQDVGFAFSEFADIDGDGDEDLFVRNYNYGLELPQLLFYENTGTPESPAFADGELFSINSTDLAAVEFADMDNDGDLDLLASAYNSYGIIYFSENTGTPNAPVFAPLEENPFGLIIPGSTPLVPALAVMDNDGDFDLICSQAYGSLLYFKNNGTPEVPAFGVPVLNPFGLVLPAGIGIILPEFGDLDEDGDLDLMFGAFNYYVGGLNFVENTGSAMVAAFGEILQAPFGIVIPSGNIAVPAFSDIDNDGDLDLFTSKSYYGSDMDFYENISDLTPNGLPVSANTGILMDENSVYSFQLADFPFTDSDPDDVLTDVVVTSLPVLGSFQFNGADVGFNQILPAADLGQLTYAPLPNESGLGYANFSFRVNDGEDFSPVEYLMNIDVTDINATSEPQGNYLFVQNKLANDLVIVKGKIVGTGEPGFSIVNEFGQVVELLPKTGNGNFDLEIPVAHLSAGVYFLVGTAEGKVLSAKFVKL